MQYTLTAWEEHVLGGLDEAEVCAQIVSNHEFHQPQPLPPAY